MDIDISFCAARDGRVFKRWLPAASDRELIALFFHPDYWESREIVEKELRARRLLSPVRVLENVLRSGVPRL
jgi:hypothetical protein